ncbi:MAG: hypothetical protein JJ885_09620 [Muricauda sp.]|jgi:hypothetical protein|nr:hypothetical protein [Allomuricauda sp.]MBO6588568.1 hypothetical protein [Allomuricauda sp.]MBO6618293.1 hypothetical protein [Allomuricauda sp.]MBO6644106.1 hypothetical protein [Allomuricauda sp.]MBO6746990.1 hypothetical protein [Allomuricauda sp.]MBO6844591.1 hypothetical protein [Allomuricauda sp.]
MLCGSFLSLRDEKEKQEGSTLTRPSDHDCSARPLFTGVLGMNEIMGGLVFD